MGTQYHVPPHAPIPPPPLHHPNSYPPAEPIHVDDWDRYREPFLPPDIVNLTGLEDMLPETGEDKEQKKEEEKKDPGPVEVVLEGYSLRKAPAESGQSTSWGRVLRLQLHYSQEKLHNIIKAHKKSSRTRNTANITSLSSSQQGVIHRLVTEKTLSETHPNAEWVVVDIQREGQWKWRKLEITTIQVILKRIDKRPKPSTKGPEPKKPAYQPEDVIDLSKPLPEKKEGKDAKKEDKDKKRGKDEKNEVIPGDMYDLPEHWQPHHGQHRDPYIHEHHWHHQQQQQQQPPPPPPDPRYQTRHHPFEPFEHLQPPMIHPEHPQPSPSDLRRTSKRRTHDHEDPMDQMQNMLENTHLPTERSESPPLARSSWSSPILSNFTPASTPPAMSPRGSLHGRQSSGDGGSRYRTRYHGNGSEVQPAITYRGERERGRRYRDERRQSRQQRAVMHYEEEPVDDYPLTRQNSRDREWDERVEALDRVLRRIRSRDGYQGRRWSLVDEPYYR